ncbi:hypothetical protein AUEXF2481DRAFT_38916 [Aureobasidium subglaciale EXF-2481]|uniref:TSEN34 N-terminal domain-containing protein n=1 Tax=Aureobasidium subglaciale (strain EXF-2481) TaxID=1043005 RepID=A0A074YRF6_AURSE|nr:uncharacterized protein AUEXF2481DRAFT_38916 [Aureobasidium subglaciale EXF-2481]KAI5201038.1 hypothetical protein E4T38_06242 [Aureobasidium subglaciale]KAI5219740.1 hypothetical protein E4T40_06300 [Aureobasidium subglaciale]KAI5223423.1 hypothetical protein E4T41_06140 [Aureobasidium subglaciale]KAI5260410.1 hypothetical protein E4T46_05997 [Aureobasidium subglaciale]KEQ96652.1 hypothetical protein AUEXF2481DRAFT_38916 [Aureobasidium subglaciale EXF-2481]
MANSTAPKPFSITFTSGRFMVYDVQTIAHIQQTYDIQGASQALEQYNPLEMRSEDVALLVNKGAAQVIKDDKSKSLQSPSNAPASPNGIPKIATASDNTQDNWNDIPDDMFASRGRPSKAKKPRSRLGISPVPSTAPGSRTASAAGLHAGPPPLRPTASQPLLRPPPPPSRPTYS